MQAVPAAVVEQPFLYQSRAVTGDGGKADRGLYQSCMHRLRRGE